MSDFGKFQCGRLCRCMAEILRHSPKNCADRLPPMFFKNKQPLNPDNLSRMVGEFYEAMGWDETGRPTDAKLSEVGINH